MNEIEMAVKEGKLFCFEGISNICRGDQSSLLRLFSDWLKFNSTAYVQLKIKATGWGTTYTSYLCFSPLSQADALPNVAEYRILEFILIWKPAKYLVLT